MDRKWKQCIIKQINMKKCPSYRGFLRHVQIFVRWVRVSDVIRGKSLGNIIISYRMNTFHLQRKKARFLYTVTDMLFLLFPSRSLILEGGRRKGMGKGRGGGREGEGDVAG